MMNIQQCEGGCIKNRLDATTLQPLPMFSFGAVVARTASTGKPWAGTSTWDQVA